MNKETTNLIIGEKMSGIIPNYSDLRSLRSYINKVAKSLPLIRHDAIQLHNKSNCPTVNPHIYLRSIVKGQHLSCGGPS